MATVSPSFYPPLYTLAPVFQPVHSNSHPQQPARRSSHTGQPQHIPSFSNLSDQYYWQWLQQQQQQQQQQPSHANWLGRPFSPSRTPPWRTPQAFHPQNPAPAPWFPPPGLIGTAFHQVPDVQFPINQHSTAFAPLVPAVQPTQPTVLTQLIAQPFQPIQQFAQPPVAPPIFQNPNVQGVYYPYQQPPPFPYVQPTVVPVSAIPELDQLRSPSKFQVIRGIPRIAFFVILLFIPFFYESRVHHIFHSVISAEKEIAGVPGSFAGGWGGDKGEKSRNWEQVKRSWGDFIDSVLKEWSTLNIVSVLLLTAIYNVLQLGGAGSRLVQCTALMSLISALMSLIFGCLYVIRFETMRKPYKAMEWTRHALKSSSMVWNVFVLLALPFVWLAWSLILFVICLMAVVWQTSGHTTPARGLAPLPLEVKIIVSALLYIGVVQLVIIIAAFSSYDGRFDKRWAHRLTQYISNALASVPQTEVVGYVLDQQNPHIDSTPSSRRTSMDQAPAPAPVPVMPTPLPRPAPPQPLPPLHHLPSNSSLIGPPTRASFPPATRRPTAVATATLLQRPQTQVFSAPTPQRLPHEPPMQRRHLAAEEDEEQEIAYPGHGVTPFIPPLPSPNGSPPHFWVGHTTTPALYTIAEGEGQEPSVDTPTIPIRSRSDSRIPIQRVSMPPPGPSPTTLSSSPSTLVFHPETPYLPHQPLSSPYMLSPLTIHTSPPPTINVLPTSLQSSDENHPEIPHSSILQPPIPLPVGSEDSTDGPDYDSQFLAPPYESYTTWAHEDGSPPLSEASLHMTRAYYDSEGVGR